MVEKEKKFLLKYMPELGSYLKLPKNIKQGYLMTHDDKQLRVRITNDFHYEICYKQNISKEERYEFEYIIPKEQGTKLYKLAEFKLEKKRFTTLYKNYKVDIDIYPSGLSVVEIEFKDQFNEIPDYCGLEVTGQNKYSNIELAKTGKEIWNPDLII